MNKTKKSMILLSICIPTYNRSKLLRDCLESICVQFNKKKIYKSIEIIISNNNSVDDTEKVVKEFQSKYKNIWYFKNKKNIGTKNTIKVALHAKGKYIWFFSDDDLHKKKSLSIILSIINSYEPDLITVNLDLWSKDLKRILDPNLLRQNKNVLLKTKKQLFSHLETKFFLPIDWYLTTYSNTILKRSIFNSGKFLLKKFNSQAGVFPQKIFVYYSPMDYNVFITKDSLIKFRADNRSFGSKNETAFLKYWYKVLPTHYNAIYQINKKNISFKFFMLLQLKNLTRFARLLFLQVFNYDISTVLVTLFYRKE